MLLCSAVPVARNSLISKGNLREKYPRGRPRRASEKQLSALRCLRRRRSRGPNSQKRPKRTETRDFQEEFDLPGVKVKENESFEQALKRFKKQCEKAGIMYELRRREHYEKPSVRRKKKALAARKRALKKLKAQHV